jgi:hypothetical protein
VTIVVAAETLLLVVVGLFVIALLRSHAEILRRLERLSPDSALPQPEDRAAGVGRAADLDGTTPDGGARRIVLSPGPDTLLAFLSTSCSVCLRLLETVAEAQLPVGLRLVVVAKDARLERLRVLRPVAAKADVVLSSAAWEGYAVPGSPYFVHVAGADGRILGEGSAAGWEQVVSLILDAAEEGAQPDVANLSRIDDVLESAGIAPGHPSLRPGAATRSNGG